MSPRGRKPTGNEPTIRVKMTREQREERAEQLARAEIKLAELKQEAREEASSSRKKVKAQQKVVTQLADEVATGESIEAAQEELFDEGAADEGAGAEAETTEKKGGKKRGRKRGK